MDYFIGDIRLFAFNYAPQDWVICSGQLLPINQYQALYSLLGIKFGGDAVNSFALPDLRGAAPNANTIYCIATEGLYPDRP